MIQNFGELESYEQWNIIWALSVKSIFFAHLKCKSITVPLGDITFKTKRGLIKHERKE